MASFEQTLDEYLRLKEEKVVLEQEEPVGPEYGKGDRYRWSFAYQRVLDTLSSYKQKISEYLDSELDTYFQEPAWNKETACRLLKYRLSQMY
jgi:hypothetical protein